MKKSIKIGFNVYTSNLDRALEDFKKICSLDVDVALNTNTWMKDRYNLYIADATYNHVLIEELEEIIWHDDYVLDTEYL